MHFFYFEVPNKDITKLKAVAGDCVDYSEIKKVAEFNQDYLLKEKGTVLNWFDVTVIDGYFSINDKVADIIKNPKSNEILTEMMDAAMSGAGEENKNGVIGMMTGPMAEMLGGFTALRLSSLMGTMGAVFTKEILLTANEKLNKIKK